MGVIFVHHWVTQAPRLGGAAVLAIVALWAWRFPELRRVERPDEVPAEVAAAAV